MSDIKVICTSDKNVSITFTWDEFTPFHLVDIEGIYGIEANVVTSENTTTDGSTYQGATAKETGTVQTAEVTKSGIGFYVTEAGEYTVESNMESVMAIPKKFKADNTDLMHTITIALREGTNMAYIGNYIGTYLLKESEEKRR